MKNYTWLILAVAIGLTAITGKLCAEPVRDAHTVAELVTDIRSIQPGVPFWVALYLDMDGAWQTYWKNPGDSGLATTIDWELPEGFKAGEIHWPFPVRLDYPEITSYGYEDQVILLSEFTLPAELAAEAVQTLKAHAKWLACGDICVPGKADLILELPVSAEAPAVDEAMREKFLKARADWPLKMSRWAVGIYDEGEAYRIQLIPPVGAESNIKRAAFFPDRDDVIDHKAMQEFSIMEGGYQLKVAKPATTYKNVTQLTGVLVADKPWQDNRRAITVDEPINF